MTESDDQNSFLDRMLRHLPGFGGYVEHKTRQRSEQQMREFVVAELEKTKSAIDIFAKGQVEKGIIDNAAKCEQLRDSIDNISQRLTSRLPDANSFFGAALIDEEKLEGLYDCEASIMDQVAELTDLAIILDHKPDEPINALAEMGVMVTALQQQTAGRERLLSELGD